MLGSEKLRDPDGGARFSHAHDIVELIVLTGDEAFLQTLKEAVGPSRRLWHVPSPDKVGDLLVAGQVGILVLDTQVVPDVAGVFVAQIKRQFPDLVVVAAGARDAQGALAGLVSAGIIYRFIHKPLSPARAKLFVDAAVKKYQEQLSRVVPNGRRPAAGLGLLLPALMTGGVAASGVFWLFNHRSSDAPSVTAQPVATPVGHEAVETAGDTADTREELLARAENAILAARLSEAATAIEAARRAGVEPGRLAFLNAQLIKSREQLKPGATSYHSKAVERPAELAAESSTDHPTQASSAVAPQPEQFDATGPDASSKPEATVQDLPAPVQEIGAVEPRIVAASALTLVKSVPPSYPTRAAQEALEGWVELEFTVASSGAVKNITVRAASPAGVFDSAAERALSRWRYQPILRDGIPSEQRASIRIRFTLKN